MQELKCRNCGGPIEVQDVKDQGLFGQCSKCGSRYSLRMTDRQHIVIEHRFPDGHPNAALNPEQTRRALLIGAGLLAAGGVAITASMLLGGRDEALIGTTVPARLIWNVGGRGVAPGQFRDQIRDVIVDANANILTHTNSGTTPQLFNGDGGFIRNWPTLSPYTRLYCALAGGGALIYNSDLEIRDFQSGALRQTITLPKINDQIVSAQYAIGRPDGSFAIFVSDELDQIRHRAGVEHADDTTKQFDDHLLFFKADGSFDRTLSGMLGGAVARDPNIDGAPAVSGVDMDAAGNIYILLSSTEDFETRSGIYIFNANGVFQRRIPINERGYGALAVTAEGTIYRGDPWSSDVTRYKDTAETKLSLSALNTSVDATIGNVSSIAALPNGDIIIGTMNERMARIAWKK